MVAPYITLDRVNVDFTLYQTSARSWRQSLFRATVGGMVGTSEQSGKMVVKALQNINLNLRSGCRLALMGHNGAGKTTLLRTLAGIYRPTAGRFAVEGRRVPLFDIGLGFDEEATGYENIKLRGLLLGFSSEQIEGRTQQIAEFSGLGDFLDFPVRTYSSGMLLRLMFSIAVSIEAEIVLMDEWIAAGDQDFVQHANERLNALIDRSHILVFASHNTELLKSLCNQAVVLDGGRIAFNGSIDAGVAYYLRMRDRNGLHAVQTTAS
jgi:ABC-type polysaccharide/polyol phosphate transport system ATPase subunit